MNLYKMERLKHKQTSSQNWSTSKETVEIEGLELSEAKQFR